eukprot:Pompholyxophrys_punicea_v1_NODE_145_length_3208_cov_8.838884.p1 type:complete len:643 gc:universal NODE_145_length_3208_cov_8.838884:1974-46(-)
MRIKTIFEEKPGIQLLWGSTDAFATNVTFMKLMQKQKFPYFHFFDYVHVLKNMRNALLNVTIKTSDCPQGFSIEDITKLRSSSVKFQRLLPHDVNPKDKMDIDNVDQLIQPLFLSELQKETGKSEVYLGLYHYLLIMQKFFLIFDDNELPFVTKISFIPDILQYLSSMESFSEKNKMTPNLFFQIRTSLDSFAKLHDFLSQTGIMPSALGTNVNENFFSLVRSKIRFPSLWEYQCYYSRAVLEHIKRNSTDSVYHYKKKRIGKKYNNCALEYSMKAIKFITQEERAAQKTHFNFFKGTLQEIAMLPQIRDSMRPTRKKLLTREVTCKSSPFEKVTVKVRPQITCPEIHKSGCKRGPKPYLYPQSLQTHLIAEHKYTKEDTEKVVSLAVSQGIYTELRLHEEISNSLADSNANCPVDHEKKEDCSSPSKVPDVCGLKTICVFILETTGLERSATIVELCIRDIVNERNFSTLVLSKQKMGQKAQELTGITDEMLVDAPSPADVVERLLQFMFCEQETTCLILMHNQRFDESKLRMLFDDSGFNLPKNWVFADTIKFFKYHNPGLQSYSLKFLSSIFSKEMTVQQHRATSDVLLLWETLQNASKAAFGISINTLEIIVQFYLEYFKSSIDEFEQCHSVIHKYEQ